jgi:3D (Asp-Asp-Asp) domain-containing protein
MKALRLLYLSLLVTGLIQARPRVMRMEATAFSTPGVTASGTGTHWGIVAADPTVLPLGSRIWVSGAGPYSGRYVVTDTGDKIIGRKVDLFIPNAAAAKQFGKKLVRVRVLRRGPPVVTAEKRS